MTNRVEDVVSAIVAGIRGALKDKDVTFDEYRQGIRYLIEASEAKETALLADMFFNTTICDIENDKFVGSPIDLEGPYYLKDAPFVDDEIKTNPEFGGTPIKMVGRVTDCEGNPVEDVVIDIWQSTPDGKYSGIHDNIPLDQYRGKIRTNADGVYSVKSTMPVPYQIPNSGPVGALLEKMGRHSWRPAHVHLKTNKKGFRPITTQAYFAGGDYVEDDCCEGMSTIGVNVTPEKYEGDYRLVEVDFTLDTV